MCVGCRASADKRGLVRVVGDGTTYSLDPRQIAPGRGAPAAGPGPWGLAPYSGPSGSRRAPRSSWPSSWRRWTPMRPLGHFGATPP